MMFTGQGQERITRIIHETLSPLLTDTLGVEHGWDAAEGAAEAIVKSEGKRLTSADLSAEYWAAHGDANALMTGNPKLRFSRRAALRRFATLPHYDEENE